MYSKTEAGLMEVWHAFQERWPVQALSGLTLEQFNAAGSRDSFCYWLESKTQDIGSIWGGSEFKFGVFECDPTRTEIDDGEGGKRLTDGRYKWLKKYGNNAQEAFASIKSKIIEIAEASQKNDFDVIEQIDLGHATKWKIAFLYQNCNSPKLLPFYKKEMLVMLTDDGSNNTATPILHQKALAKVPEGKSVLEFSMDVWRDNSKFSELDIAGKICRISEILVQNNGETFTSESPRGLRIRAKLSELGEMMRKKCRIPQGWKTCISKGNGYYPKVSWVAFLPPAQKVTDGVYVGVCFGRDGNGVVVGCMASNSQKEKYSTLEFCDRTGSPINVNGQHEGTKYNEMFVNPVDYLIPNVNENVVVEHVDESIAVCERILAGGVIESADSKTESCEFPKHDGFRSVAPKRRHGESRLVDVVKDPVMQRFVVALRTKPFAILAGHSGTGKSQMVRRLAYMTCADEGLMAEAKVKNAPGNFCMIQVRPNWHDSSDLLGYYSELGKKYRTTEFVEFVAKAYAYPEIPFFVCLDEMNLAPVEQYFAEYLSAIESADVKDGKFLTDALVSKEFPADEVMSRDEVRFSESKAWFEKHGLTIPKNLFVVGTVNMDETTCQFSRKVLDRAMTLLMNEVKFAEMGKSVDPSKEPLLDDAGVAFFMQGGRRGRVDAVEAGLLDSLNKPLVNTPFVVAYRFANEYALYEEALANLNGVPQLDSGEADEAKIAEYWKKVSEHAIEALDHVVLMKLLPRIHGMKDVVKGIFEGRKIDEKDVPGLKDEVKADGLSAGMMTEILKRGDEYLTFWP